MGSGRIRAACGFPLGTHSRHRLKEALALLKIRALDHFIVGDGVPASFAQRGWM
jgi:DNA repair protein RadC